MLYLFWIYGDIRIEWWVSGITSMVLIYVNVGFKGKVFNFSETVNVITALISFMF